MEQSTAPHSVHEILKKIAHHIAEKTRKTAKLRALYAVRDLLKSEKDRKIRVESLEAYRRQIEGKTPGTNLHTRLSQNIGEDVHQIEKLDGKIAACRIIINSYNTQYPGTKVDPSREPTEADLVLFNDDILLDIVAIETSKIIKELLPKIDKHDKEFAEALKHVLCELHQVSAKVSTVETQNQEILEQVQLNYGVTLSLVDLAGELKVAIGAVDNSVKGVNDWVEFIDTEVHALVKQQEK